MEWISVKDRFPDEHKNYSMRLLVYTDEGISSAWFPNGFKELGIVGGWESCHYCGGQSEVHFIEREEMHPRSSKQITHWMPLPSSPREKS
jgi:hypothetical protein